MANDYVVNYTATHAGFTETTGKVISQMEAVSDNSNKLIRQLEKQAGVLAAGVDGWKLHTAAMRGAGAETLERIIELQNFNNKMKELKVEMAKPASSNAMNMGLLTPDPFQMGLHRMGVNNASTSAAEAAAASRDARDPFTTGMAAHQAKNDPWQRGLDRMALANDEQRKKDLTHQELILRRRAAAEDAFRSKDMQGGGGGKWSKTQWGVIELGRGVEDFIAGSVYGGFKGGILAASNNISQIGMAFGPHGAIIGTVASAVAILGVTAYEAFDKTEDAARQLDEARQRYHANEMQRAQERASAAAEDLSNIHNQRRELEGLGKAVGKPGGLEAADRALEANQDAQNSALIEQMGIVHQMQMMEKTHPAALDPNSKEAGWERAKRAKMNPKDVLALEKEDRDAMDAYNKLDSQKKQVGERRKGLEEQREKLGLKAQDARQADANQTRLQQAEDQRVREAKARQAEAERTARAKDWFRGRSEQVLLGNMTEDKDRSKYLAQKEHEESLRKSKMAAALGDITPQEREALDKASGKKRDKDIRQAMYGDLKADGATGFSGAQYGSVESVNQIMRSLRQGEQDKQIAELKRNGDILEQVKTVQTEVLGFMKANPVNVLVF